MKLVLLGTLLSPLLLTVSVSANTYTLTADNLSATIPDGDLTGYQSSQTASGLPGAITHVSVGLNLSGGFNGDLYAYLYHNNTMAVLLNRVGRTGLSGIGYPDAGFGANAVSQQFTLDDQATHDVHLYRTFGDVLNANGQVTGLWQPDGRLLDPLSPGSIFDTAARSNTLGIFNNMDPNGLWLLFVSDVSPGGESLLNRWDLTISTVPEPSTFGLLSLSVCLLLGSGKVKRVGR
jgi:hypothetical protein